MAALKAVIYARYSSSSQREESIEAQLNACNAYVERNGYVVIRSYAVSAKTGTNDNRPELQQMIWDSKRKQFNVFLVYKLLICTKKQMPIRVSAFLLCRSDENRRWFTFRFVSPL